LLITGLRRGRVRGERGSRLPDFAEEQYDEREKRERSGPMGVIAGVLVGLVVLAILVGFHTGPHTHLAAGALGLLVAAPLAVLAAEANSSGGLWALLGGDLTLSAGIAFLAWRALAGEHRARSEHRLLARRGEQGVAVSDLDPEGIVRLRGEDWTALAVNAPVRRGSAVQVVGGGGVRLEVWGFDIPLGFEPSAAEEV
jgi:membrane protein implicated in regulation of membrane protease activity